MRVLVTGGTGYLGRVLLRQGLEAGLELAATHHRMPPTFQQVQWFGLDIQDQKAVEQAFEAFAPEAVIHTAYSKQPQQLQGVVVKGSAHVAKAAQRVGARLLHLSTDVVFDGENPPYCETDLPNPLYPYGVAKLEAEQQVQRLHPEAVVVRTSIIWGLDPLDPTSQQALALAQGQQSGALFADEFRSFVHVDDLAAALLELLRLPYSGVLHLGGGQTLSRLEFGQRIAAHFGLSPDQVPSGSIADFGSPRPKNCALDSSRAAGLLRTRLFGVDQRL